MFFVLGIIPLYCTTSKIWEQKEYIDNTLIYSFHIKYLNKKINSLGEGVYASGKRVSKNSLNVSGEIILFFLII